MVQRSFDFKYPRISHILKTQTENTLKFNQEIRKNSNSLPGRNVVADQEDAGNVSQSSISSADDNDLEILMNGDHRMYFDAYEMMKDFYMVNKNTGSKGKEKINLK